VAKYAVDTNVFIEAKNRYYPFELPPGRWFWDLIDRAVDAGLVSSAEKMRDELVPANDQLTVWAKAHGADLWTPPNSDILSHVRASVTTEQARVAAEEIWQAAVDEFARGDVFLIATAAANDLTVVTHEQSSPTSKKRILIPDACAANGIPYVDPWAMLRDLDTQLGE
jgi:hypothetical protein